MSSEHVASHYNAVPNTSVKDRTNSRIYHLRNFNNWIKSMLISEFLDRLHNENCRSATVLDLCCGKGGDLLKWKIGNIKEVVMADIATVALDYCKSRYKDLCHRMTREDKRPFRAHFINADLTKDDLRSMLPNQGLQFDICSCQFSLHYSFSSEEAVRRLLLNATQSLRPNGYFIGTMPNASTIVHFLRRSNGSFKNDVCHVDYTDKSQPFDENFQPPLFGAKLNFALDEVVNCPEFLAYFPLIVKILEELGMKLVYKYSFPEATQIYLKRDEREAKSLLQRMKALEEFPSRSGTNLTAKDEEYEHAKQKFEKLNPKNSNEKIGTLSKSEWEVISMYSVFAFVKL